MLRSIRLVLELFNPGRMRSAVSSSDGIDVQVGVIFGLSIVVCMCVDLHVTP